MSTPPPGEDGLSDLGDLSAIGELTELADLSELAATDALLDRLASRSPSDEDLRDPMALALNSLLTEIDAEAQADSATARLVEVLAGRPLYIDGPSVDEALIDLTAGSGEVPAQPSDPEQPEKPEKPGTPEEPGSPGDAPVPITAARSRRWQVAASKVSAPVAAASIAILVLLGGGVSAAVAGDPMAPLNGVGSVMAKLPGVNNSSDHKLEDAKTELALAKQLATSDPAAARQHLANAASMLSDLPDEKTADLDQQVALLATQLPGTDPSDPAVVGATPVATTPVPTGSPTSDGPGTGVPTTTPVTGDPTTVPTTTTTDDPGPGQPSSTTSTTPPPDTSTSSTTTAPTSDPATPADPPTGGSSTPPTSTTTDATEQSAPNNTPSDAPSGN